jgi:hypothetical protein
MHGCRVILRSLLLAAACGAIACSSARPVVSVESRVRDLTPALRLTFEPSSEPVPPAFELRRFTFVPEPPHAWPYGNGFAVADRASGEVLWIYLHNGDCPPHEIRWLDFDGDGREDIFFHAGFEDVFTTHLYLNRVRSSRYAVSHFAQAYENDDVYAVVVDLDADGRPELLAPDAYLPEDDPCAAAFAEVAAASEAWNEEYRRVAGRFADPDAGPDALNLFSKPEIVSFGPPPGEEAVTRHLQVRERLIAESLDALPAPCRARAEPVPPTNGGTTKRPPAGRHGRQR